MVVGDCSVCVQYVERVSGVLKVILFVGVCLDVCVVAGAVKTLHNITKNGTDILRVWC